jgi:site-specific DNA recombinase
MMLRSACRCSNRKSRFGRRPELDRWLARLFDPENLDDTIAQLLVASKADDTCDTKVEAAQRKLVDCDDRLGKYRAALDSGADPAVVTGWMSEVQGERLAAEAVLSASGPSEALSEASLRTMIESLGDVAQVLAEADPKDKAAVYTDLGITVIYHPEQRRAVVEARPKIGVLPSVSEGGLELRRQR